MFKRYEVLWGQALCALLLSACWGQASNAGESGGQGIGKAGQNLETTLFWDDFETSLDLWQVSGTCSLSGAASRSGQYGVRCDDTASLTADIATEGATSIQVDYARRTQRYDSGEELVAEYSFDGGTTWQFLESFEDGGYADVSHAVSNPTAAPIMKLRLRANANGFLERFDLDDVEVTADLPMGPPDDDCDGEDDDADGSIDEDVACGEQIHVRMDPTGGYFDMPWPSDHRRRADGRPDLAGFPGLDRGLFGAGNAALAAAQEHVTDFGLNSAAYFTLTGDLDPAALPQRDATTAADSPVMLVNLDDPSAPRVPLLLDYKSAPGDARPGNLLTVLPHPGFGLDPDTRYAVVVFQHLPAVGAQLAPAPLLAQLDAGNASGTGLSGADFALLQQHRAEVGSYVSAHTTLAPSDVAAFAVFTTQPMFDELDGVAAAVADMSDAEVLDRIQLDTVPAEVCQPCPAGQPCPSASIYANVDIPVYIKPIELSYRPLCVLFGGNNCVATGGGEIELDGAGRAIEQTQQNHDTNVRVKFRVPCDGQRPADGWPILFHATGTGGTLEQVDYVERVLHEGGHSLRHIAAGVTVWGTAPRHDTSIADTVLQLMGGDADEAAGHMYMFFFNPVALAHNPLQMAADAWFMKRVLGLFEQAASAASVSPADLSLPPGSFSTDASSSLLYGQSQGSTSGPLALAIPPGQGGYDDAFLNATAAHSIFEFVTGRSDIREPFEAVFQLEGTGELDRYHPLVQFFQATSEVGRGGNYASRVTTENLLITQGYSDVCSLREDAAAIATELYRAGKLEAVDTGADFGGVMPPIDGIQTVLGATPRTLPLSGNLPNGGTGVYLVANGDHGGGGAGVEGGHFMNARALGQTPTIAAPPYNDTLDFDCAPQATRTGTPYP